MKSMIFLWHKIINTIGEGEYRVVYLSEIWHNKNGIRIELWQNIDCQDIFAKNLDHYAYVKKIVHISWKTHLDMHKIVQKLNFM